MKIEEFKRELRSSLEKICQTNGWSFDNSKHRGMAFEDWCFGLLAERYPNADNDPQQCIIRSDDAGVDIFFESRETEEVYIVQCRHPKISASDPIPEDEVKSFFANYGLLRDNQYLQQRKTKNPKLEELAAEFGYWTKRNFVINFVFISSGQITHKISALLDKFNRDHKDSSVNFNVWDLAQTRDQFVTIKSVEEQYPDEVQISLAKASYMFPNGELENITFVVPGTVLQHVAQ